MEVCFSSQNGDHAWGLYSEEQHSVVRFLSAKGLNAKDIHKETFPVYVVCHIKRFTTGSRNVANVLLMTKRLKRRCGSG
jgi:hypothetical protein